MKLLLNKLSPIKTSKKFAEIASNCPKLAKVAKTTKIAANCAPQFSSSDPFADSTSLQTRRSNPTDREAAARSVTPPRPAELLSDFAVFVYADVR